MIDSSSVPYGQVEVPVAVHIAPGNTPGVGRFGGTPSCSFFEYCQLETAHQLGSLRSIRELRTGSKGLAEKQQCQKG